MVPGVPQRFARLAECPAAFFALPSALPVVLQPSSGKRGRNGNVLENQPRKYENGRGCVRLLGAADTLAQGGKVGGGMSRWQPRGCATTQWDRQGGGDREIWLEKHAHGVGFHP
eukprot:353270-Chlamydomonas_euryale.AAC.3